MLYGVGRNAADSSALSSNASMLRFVTIGDSGDPMAAPSTCSKNVASKVK